MDKDHFVTRTAEFFFDENEILIIRILPEILIDELDIYDNNLVIRNITGGKKCARLFDARAKNWKMSDTAKSETRKQYDPEKIAALAILINSSLGSGIMNFFNRFSFMNVPHKYFTEEKVAKEWLLSFRK
jgi:hypothetical protein